MDGRVSDVKDPEPRLVRLLLSPRRSRRRGRDQREEGIRKTAPDQIQDREQFVKQGLRLAWFIVVWDVIEGAVAVTAGLLVGSIALLGFGIDSTIEVFAASVVIWQLRAGTSARQGLALRLIGTTFFLLAAYVGFEAIRDLATADRAGESLIGIVLNIVAVIVMVPVALAQRRTGEALENPVLVAQSKETWVSNYLSITVLAGLAFNAWLGWWWADPVAALAVAAIAVREGWETWEESRSGQDSASREAT